MQLELAVHQSCMIWCTPDRFTQFLSLCSPAWRPGWRSPPRSGRGDQRVFELPDCRRRVGSEEGLETGSYLMSERGQRRRCRPVGGAETALQATARAHHQSDPQGEGADANARHEHEWRVVADKAAAKQDADAWRRQPRYQPCQAPAARRYDAIVGGENVVAGTGRGLRGRVHADLAWAKLRTLVEGARLASGSLWL